MPSRLLGRIAVLVVVLVCGSTAAAQKDKDKKLPTLTEARGITQFEYAADGSFIAMDYRASFTNQPHRTDAIIGVWDTKTGECRLTVEKPLKKFERLAVSPDGKTIAAMASLDKQVRVWDATTGKVLDDQALPDSKGKQSLKFLTPVLKFAPDSKRLFAIHNQQPVEITVGGKIRNIGPKVEFAEFGDVAIDAGATRIVAVRNV
jgi:WD40 repeat protein